jgi:chromosome segregation ATPase
VATNTDRIQELEKNLIVLQTEVSYFKKALEDETNAKRDAETKVMGIQNEASLLKQRLDDHLKRMEVWSGRLWGLIVLLIGAVLSLSSGLIVTLVRK